MLEIGGLLDERYKIIKDIGQGRWGRVYLSANIKLGNYWAIKEISLKEDSRVNLLAEPDILKKLNHPSLPRIIDVIITGDYLYIVEDYFEGRNLRDIISQRVSLSEDVAVDWGRQLCQILIYLHSLKPHPIIYRDMKPGNIIIDCNNNVKLIDFGIARVHSGQENDTTFIGTIGYAAPEQYSLGRRSDERTDVYGLGVTLFHILTGVSPNEFVQRLPPVRQIKKDVSPMLEKIVSKCTEPDPDERYQCAQELMNDLNGLSSSKDENGGNFRVRLKALLNPKSSRVVFIEKLIGTAIIAVGGTDRGVGCTHVSISLAAFLARQKFRVAVVEMNENPALCNLDQLNSASHSGGSFNISGIDFIWQNKYKRGTVLTEALQAGYEFVIIDLGQSVVQRTEDDLKEGFSSSGRNCWYNETLRAHINIMVAGSAVWQANKLISCLDSEVFDSWKVFLTTPDQLFYNEIRKQVNRDFYFSQFSPDPFRFNAHQEMVFTEILRDFLPRNIKKKNKLLFWR